MNHIDLNHKLNMGNISIKEYATIIEHFCCGELVVETADETIGTIVVKIYPNHLPHLIGLDYCFDTDRNKAKYEGKDGLDNMKSGNLTIEQLKKNFNDNSKANKISKFLKWNFHILPRFEWLPYFFYHLKTDTNKFFKNENLKTKMRGEFLIFEKENKDYLIMSLIKSSSCNDYYAESFVSSDGTNYYDPDNEIEIKNIYFKSFNA